MYTNLDIVFLGGLFPKEKEDEILGNSIGGIQNAANNLQWELVMGLNSNLEKPVKIINSLYIGSFPKRYKKIVIDTYNFSNYTDNRDNINVGFLNITGIKNISRYITLKPYLKDWALSTSNKKKIIIAYAMTSTFTHLLEYVKKVNSDVITCLVVPDLPQYMNLSGNRNYIYNNLKKVELKLINRNMEYIDCYVLLTNYMRQALNINVPSVVVEGISTNIFDKVDYIPQKEGIKTVLYSGGLNEKYGVVDLVKAFEKLPANNYRLIICGSGEAEEVIRRACKRDKRIIFKGLLKRDEVLQLQKSSTILVNPRPNNEEYTKYSFPSKIMEYMSSGTPVIAFMLDGMPKEYGDYIYPIIEGKDGLFLTLDKTLSKSEKELYEKGSKAKEFVLSQKNNVKQVEKILNMINKL
ncbi:glycosyltransferase [Chryseomicrobium palamuruense]|uniref:Glycosyltransferase n=1 Tax=Chryseomicrobium palamuruense TaxID=682973 RepID=A0ABV8UUG4_9BACL